MNTTPRSGTEKAVQKRMHSVTGVAHVEDIKLPVHVSDHTTEPCEHMRLLLAVADSMGVWIDGCGCDGSPWLVCDRCNLVVYNQSSFKGAD